MIERNFLEKLKVNLLSRGIFTAKQLLGVDSGTTSK